MNYSIVRQGSYFRNVLLNLARLLSIFFPLQYHNRLGVLARILQNSQNTYLILVQYLLYFCSLP